MALATAQSRNAWPPEQCTRLDVLYMRTGTYGTCVCTAYRATGPEYLVQHAVSRRWRRHRRGRDEARPITGRASRRGGVQRRLCCSAVRGHVTVSGRGTHPAHGPLRVELTTSDRASSPHRLGRRPPPTNARPGKHPHVTALPLPIPGPVLRPSGDPRRNRFVGPSSSTIAVDHRSSTIVRRPSSVDAGHGHAIVVASHDRSSSVFSLLASSRLNSPSAAVRPLLLRA